MHESEFLPFTPKPAEGITLLVVSPSEEDHSYFRRAFHHPAWSLQRAGSLRDAVRTLHAAEIPVVICERDLPDGGWQDLLRKLEGLPKPPFLIVASRLADERLWAEVLNLGGYDVLLKPFELAEVLRVTAMAWRQWAHRETSTSQSFPAYRSTGSL